jgi:hypothetical protein
MKPARTSTRAAQAAVITIAMLLFVNACGWLYDKDPRTVESTPALFLDDSDLPEGWIVTRAPMKYQASAYAFAISHMGTAARPTDLPQATQEITKLRSPEGAARHYNGQLLLPTLYDMTPEGFTAYPNKADAYRLGCAPFRAYLHCLYRARYGAYTVSLGITLNPSTAAVDLAKMITAIERRLGRSP